MCTAYHREESRGHFRENGVEVGLVLSIDESIVEHTLTLMAKQLEHLPLVSDDTWVSLKNACTGNTQYPSMYMYVCT